MTKDGAIVLSEAVEIMESLPSQMQHDEQIMDSVIESLQSGVSKLAARQDALEIAQLKMQEAMAHGFNLVNTEIQGIKHSAEIDRVHATYAQKAAEQAKAMAEQAWAKTQEVAIGVAKAEAKADSARDLAKTSGIVRGLDPFVAMGIAGILVLITLAFFTRVEREPPRRSADAPTTESSPTPTSVARPTPNPPYYSCVNRTDNRLNGTIDFARCRKVGEV